MAQIEGCQPLPEPELPFAYESRPRQQPEPADVAKLAKALGRFASLPEWLRSELCLYARQRWYGWKPHMATRYINRLASQQCNIWSWLLAHCELHGWQDLRRCHLESWQDARRNAGLNVISCYTELSDLRAFLKFVDDRGQPLDPNIFRIPPPNFADPLPKHLSTADYERLVKTVLAETEQPTLAALAGRAWFLTLAHTGMRLNELLDLRLGDIDFANGRILICNPKGGHDRVVFMTPSLGHSLHFYIMQRPAGADDHLWRYNGRLLADEAVRDQLARWGQLCGVKVTPHQLRHTFATQLVNHGLPIDSVRKLLGHRTLNMTQHLFLSMRKRFTRTFGEKGLSSKYTLAQQVKLGSPKHGPLDHFEAIDLALDLAIADGQGERGEHGSIVTAQAGGEALQLSDAGRLSTCQPFIEVTGLALAEHFSELLYQDIGSLQLWSVLTQAFNAQAVAFVEVGGTAHQQPRCLACRQHGGSRRLRGRHGWSAAAAWLWLRRRRLRTQIAMLGNPDARPTGAGQGSQTRHAGGARAARHCRSPPPTAGASKAGKGPVCSAACAWWRVRETGQR